MPKILSISLPTIVAIIRLFYPQYRWIATVIDVFIMLSITVSFITQSTGMKHVCIFQSPTSLPLTKQWKDLQPLPVIQAKLPTLYLASFNA
jgi:hypothetical protein